VLLIAALAAVQAQMITVSAQTPRGKTIYDEQTHIELAREYDRIFAWKKAAYEVRFEYGAEIGAPPVALLVLKHPHARSPRPYTVTLQYGPFDKPLGPGDRHEMTLAEGELTFVVQVEGEATPDPLEAVPTREE
jgi:hypothetical protein